MKNSITNNSESSRNQINSFFKGFFSIFNFFENFYLIPKEKNNQLSLSETYFQDWQKVGESLRIEEKKFLKELN